MINISNNVLKLQFDEHNGALREIVDLSKNLRLAENTQDSAFILEYKQQGNNTSEFQSFSWKVQGQVTLFQWELETGILICAEITAKEKAITFSARVEGISDQKLYSLEYPLLDGIKSLASDNDYVAHSFATGLLIQNPMKAFAEDEDGFRYVPYPESFSGASMQFFTYYSKGLSGLYFASYDGEFYPKWLNFYKKNNALRASHIFGYEDVGEDKSLEMNWKFVVQLTEGNDWYEAADLYKVWAHEQIWCGKGKRKDISVDEKASWLLEKTGAATFGINGMHDRTRWIRKYHDALRTPIFHVTGPDWAKEKQSYGGGIPGGYDDWFPTRFNQSNVKTWRELGDFFAPFEFDFLISTEKSDAEIIKKNLQVWPDEPKSCDNYTFSMLCPLCDYTKKLHIARDVQVIKESGANAMYYDISANNILKTCMSEDHGHHVGAGKEMTEAYREIYHETKVALSAEKGKYVPLGTEMINETFIDVIDYYQARANAQPCSALETWPYRTLIQNNQAFLIPMFHYVYSEYAPIRLDGWGKLVEEGGDLIYHTIAKTYLWGGLFEINSEYSPMEVIDIYGENKSEEHYCNFEKRKYKFDETIASYLARFAALRVREFGKPIRYGEMLRPPNVQCKYTERSYLHYNHGENSGEYNSSGFVARESVVASKYQLDGEVSIYIANTLSSEVDVGIEDDFIKPYAFYRLDRNQKKSEFSVEEGASTPPPNGNHPPTLRLEVGVLPSAHADKYETEIVNGNQLQNVKCKPFEIVMIRAAKKV